MRTAARRLLQALLALTVLAAVAGGAAWKAWVVDEPGPGFTREEVLAVIAQESPVFYRDGASRIGVFFDQEHRAYVPFASLPEDYIHAIVASEDGNFWDHPGVDPKHVVRALWQNIRAGQVVAGGSTLTQQTAKNLFYRPDRSLRSKLVELANALRLEAHFSKQDILEFYANQFHVSANGRGIGIAARYFFDKDVAHLSLKECAFIAGMVKAPSRYNPFIGEGEERRANARAAAEARTAYVLRRMVEVGYLDEAQLAGLLAAPLTFRKGDFQYDRSVILDEVQRQLEEPVFVELFERAGIDNPSTAGIHIITTVDAVAQREATWALWRHLTELGAQLEPDLAWVLDGKTTMPMEPGVALQAHTFRVARVMSATPDGVTLDVGGRPCALDEEGLGRLRRLAKKEPSALVPTGSLVLAAIRAPGTCEIEARPRLQGAVVALEDGEIRAMVGGNDNRNFNRASSANRQFGSTWKPLVYLAAVSLGWLPTDVLDNGPNVFTLRDVWYYPRADHASDPWVSMSMAGARSENLASVWLLDHLTDRLNAEQFRRLAVLVDMAPAEGGDTAWLTRVRDEFAIQSSPERYEEYAFFLARQDVLGELPFSEHPEDAAAVRSLAHGRGGAAERARLLRTADTAERRSRLAALDNSLVALVGRLDLCTSTPDDPACLPSEAEALVDPEARLVLGRVHPSTIRLLRDATARRAGELAGRDPWDPEVLSLNPDFRTLVGIRYVIATARALGVRAALPEGMSLPLGSADVTLLEMANAYQGMLAGQGWSFPGQGFEEGSVIGLRHAFDLGAVRGSNALIAEVRDQSGNVLYRLRPEPRAVVDPVSGELVGDILRNVVRAGTGRRAEGAVKSGGIPIPLAGKTGTTNDYRNAAFIGFAPRFDADGLGWGDAWTVAAYVGYDDNRSMRRGRLKVQGASGALPIWLGTVEGLVESGVLGRAATAEYAPSAGLVRVDVAAQTGVTGTGATALTATGTPPDRRFAPLTEPPAAAASAPDVPPPAPSEAPPGDPALEPEEGAPPPAEPPSVWDGL
jgi:membrane peptidoglycan carboxypeptidase